MADVKEDEKEEQPFRLLDLPAEIWTKICKLAVETDEAHVLVYTTTILNHKDGKPTVGNLADPSLLQQPPITRVCKKIRKECLPHFYSSNYFMFKEIPKGNQFGGSLDVINAWMDSITPENWPYLEAMVYVIVAMGYKDDFEDECEFRAGHCSSFSPDETGFLTANPWWTIYKMVLKEGAIPGMQWVPEAF